MTATTTTTPATRLAADYGVTDAAALAVELQSSTAAPTPQPTMNSRPMARISRNKAGRRFALILDSRMTGKPCAGTYGVWSESLNYVGHLRGGIARNWRYCQMGMSLEDAEALFARKIAGRQRP